MQGWKPPVRDSAERVSEGRGQVNGTQVRGAPSRRVALGKL